MHAAPRISAERRPKLRDGSIEGYNRTGAERRTVEATLRADETLARRATTISACGPQNRRWDRHCSTILTTSSWA
jgi:hypothetical protein